MQPAEITAEQLDQCLAALAHRMRRTIIDRLATSDARVTDLAADLTTGLNTVSKHVRILEDAGLIRRQVHGRDHMLSVEVHRLAAIRHWIDTATDGWTAKLTAIDAYLTYGKVEEE